MVRTPRNLGSQKLRVYGTSYAVLCHGLDIVSRAHCETA